MPRIKPRSARASLVSSLLCHFLLAGPYTLTDGVLTEFRNSQQREKHPVSTCQPATRKQERRSTGLRALRQTNPLPAGSGSGVCVFKESALGPLLALLSLFQLSMLPGVDSGLLRPRASALELSPRPTRLLGRSNSTWGSIFPRTQLTGFYPRQHIWSPAPHQE